MSHRVPSTIIVLSDAAQEFKPLSPAPLTSSRSVDLSSMGQDLARSGGQDLARSGLTITVRPDPRSGTSGRRVDSSTELDVAKLAVFGVEMEEVIQQTLEVRFDLKKIAL